MVFCSNCGAPLRGVMKFCSNCGYRIEADELEQIKQEIKAPLGLRNQQNERRVRIEDKKIVDDDDSEDDEYNEYDDEDIESAEVIAEPTYTERPIPPGTRVREKIPKSNNCLVCSIKTEDICFFCDWGICKNHGVNLQIKTDTGRFGNIIQSCPECANRKAGRQPTEEEAAEVGFFFKIKPYHEWKIIG